MTKDRNRVRVLHSNLRDNRVHQTNITISYGLPALIVMQTPVPLYVVPYLRPFLCDVAASSLAVQNNKANFYCTITLRKEMSGERYLAKLIDAMPRNKRSTRNILILKYILGVPVEDFSGGVLFLFVYNLVPRWEIWVRN